MATFKVYWHYAVSRKGSTRISNDPRRAGGEYKYEAENEEAALKQLELDLSLKEWTQPFDASLIDASAYELVGSTELERSEVLAALASLSSDELARLLADVSLEARPNAPAP